jgi:mannose-1-phosphate guanylyltransferase
VESFLCCDFFFFFFFFFVFCFFFFLFFFEHLSKAGVTKIVLAIAYKPELMAEKLNKELAGAPFKVEVIYSHEKVPLGTAGPLALARDHLISDGKPFFVLNADVTCKYPFKEMLSFHKAHGREGTIMVTKVEEPSRYGVVVYDQSGKIERFVEKPANFVGNRINAGMFVLFLRFFFLLIFSTGTFSILPFWIALK